jgi:SPP1 family predicted phage head-tail adaptor
MSIGLKVKRVRIERQTATPDGQGGSTLTWSPRCVVWAHERPLTGREALQAAQVTATLSSVWEIWYRTDISVKDRIKFGARTCEIESFIDPRDDRKELWLYTSEVQA